MKKYCGHCGSKVKKANLQTHTIGKASPSGHHIETKIQQSTVSSDDLKLSGPLKIEDIDFDYLKSHISIHKGGAVAGSQFNPEAFKGEIIEGIKHLLKAHPVQKDQHGKAELTFKIKTPSGSPAGWSGVHEIKDFKKAFPNVAIELKPRETELDGVKGILETYKGVKGVWLPESENVGGKWQVSRNEDGSVKNPKGKFDPYMNIATVSEDDFKNNGHTDLVSVILITTKEGKTMAVTAYPGKITPPAPTAIPKFKVDTVNSQELIDFWKDHVFVKIDKKTAAIKKYCGACGNKRK
jgi:hypothetical protein